MWGMWERLSSSSYLKIHQKAHSIEKPYKCEECGQGFNQSSRLQIHQLIHTGGKPYKSLKSVGRDSVVEQILKFTAGVHTGEKPYNCEELWKSLPVRPLIFRPHQRVHSGEKPFKCEKCGKSFSGVHTPSSPPKSTLERSHTNVRSVGRASSGAWTSTCIRGSPRRETI